VPGALDFTTSAPAHRQVPRGGERGFPIFCKGFTMPPQRSSSRQFQNFARLTP